MLPGRRLRMPLRLVPFSIEVQNPALRRVA